VRGYVPILEVPLAVVIGNIPKLLFQGNSIRRKVDKDKPTPHANPGLGQRELLVLEIRKIPPARHGAKLAVELPGEPVKSASEVLHVPILLAENPTAMEAHVVEGLNLRGAGAHDYEGFSGYFVDDMVANSRDLFHTARHLPRAIPHSFAFEPVEIVREVAILIDLNILAFAQVVVSLFTQAWWHPPGIGV
jgi:hypothetical protein